MRFYGEENPSKDLIIFLTKYTLIMQYANNTNYSKSSKTINSQLILDKHTNKNTCQILVWL